MKDEDIESYREKIDIHLKEKVNDIETNISFIIIGSLGFLLTINEKFIGLSEAKLKCLLFLSIFFLLGSFVIFLLNKHLTTKYDRKIIDFLDEDMKANDEYSDNKLLKIWSKFDSNLTLNRNILYWFLGLGIFFEIVFFTFNVFTSEKKSEKSVNSVNNIILEIKNNDSTIKLITINSDTISIK